MANPIWRESARVRCVCVCVCICWSLTGVSYRVVEFAAIDTKLQELAGVFASIRERQGRSNPLDIRRSVSSTPDTFSFN